MQSIIDDKVPICGGVDYDVIQKFIVLGEGDWGEESTLQKICDEFRKKGFY